MPSNQTTNYQLSQWAKSDQVKMEDFNADNAKIDGALASQAEALAALTAATSKHGNCQIYTTSYVGTGSGSNTLTFPQVPELVIIAEHGKNVLYLLPGDITYPFWSSTKDYTMTVTWSGSTVTWLGNDVNMQLNAKNKTYHVIAFWSAG